MSPGTPKAEKDETLRWPVALIQREEHDGTRRYYIEAQEVRVVSGTTGKDGSFVPGEKEELCFPREDFGDAAELVLHLLKNVSGEEVEVTEGLEAFLDAVNIFDLEAKDGGPYRLLRCLLASRSTSDGLQCPLSSSPR